jgi:hypothetical protein
MLTAKSDGTKCKPFVLMMRKRPVPELEKKFGKKLELCWANKSWFDDDLTSQYLKRIFGLSLFGKRLLVWDSYRCHISVETKKQLRLRNIYSGIVPGGCTKFVQVCTLCINLQRQLI